MQAAIPPEDALDLPRQDLLTAVETAMARDGHLLTAGEQVALRRLRALSRPAQSLVARLAARQPRLFLQEELRYAEIPDLAAAAAELVQSGWALDGAALAPLDWLLEAHTAEELKAACRALGLPTGGRRAELELRLRERGQAGPLRRPSLWLLHRALLRRLCRLYLNDHQGDLSALVVARLDLLRPATYRPTGGAGLFRDRRALLRYERGLALRWSLDAEGLLRELPASLQAFAQAPPEDAVRARFSGRRFDEGIATEAAALLERAGRVEEAEAVYAQLLAASPRKVQALSLRRALCLGRLGRAAEAVELLRGALPHAREGEALALERSGARLARQAGQAWPRRPALALPPERVWTLESGERQRRRPGWRAGGRALPVEAALVARLREAGREPAHGENAPWSSLFALLFAEALFAPVPGMLPSPLLSAPLDLGTPHFFQARTPLLDKILEELRQGRGPERLERELDARQGETIAGLRWELFGADGGEGLLRLCAALPGPGLAELMRAFVEDWSGAQGGLPDLCILPGPPVLLPEASPGLLPAGLLFAEVKGPGDQLRDEQRVWLHRLLQAGVQVELWRVEAASGPSSA